MNVNLKFFMSIGLILASAVIGYISQRRKWVAESTAKPIMTFVTVVAYPTVGFLAIWGAPLRASDAWLPLLGGLQATVMALLALAIGTRLFPDRAERGLVGLSSGIGNHGATMAGFAVYLLFGADGLGINTIYAIYTFFALVLLSYTIAQRYSPDATQISIPRLMLTNVLHWRAMGLYSCTAAIIITCMGIPKPPQIHAWHLLDICIFLLIAISYFAIGLRLHLHHVNKVTRAILCVIGVRHVAGPLIGLTLVAATRLTPWPLQDLSLHVVLLQSSVPMGVMGVAVANMFHLKADEASAIFVISSLAYLIIGLPIVFWIFGS